MQQKYTNIIKDGFVASLLTVVSTGALIAFAPNLSRTVLALMPSAFGIAATASYQNNRLRKQLSRDFDHFLFQESIEIQHSIALLRESMTDTITDNCLDGKQSNDTPSETKHKSENKTNCRPLIQISSHQDGPTLDSIEQTVDSDPQTMDPQTVIDWLNHQNIKVDDHNSDTSRTAQVFGRLASFLGKHYAELKPFHKMLKRHLATGNRFKFSLAEQSQRQIQICTQFCHELHQLSLLSYYRYSKQEKIIHAASQKRSDIDEFFRGGWFELYVVQTVEQFLQDNGIDYQYLLNSKVVFESGDRFELDLMFLVDGQLLWLECKSTKDFNRYLKQYSQHRENLSLDKSRALLVVLDCRSDKAESLTDMWGLTVISQHDLISKLSAILDPGPPASTSTEENITQLFHPNFAKFLRQKKVYPTPKNRMMVLQEFINLVDTTDDALTLREIKECLALTFEQNSQVSKTKLQSLLRIILRTRCLQDENGEPIINFNTPIHHLESSEIEGLEQQCVQQYATIALQFNPDYFTNLDNCHEFEHVVGSQVPTADILQQLRDSAA